MKYAKQLTAQRNMGGFMKGILIKRLESSFFAFSKTLGRFIESYEKFIEMMKDTGLKVQTGIFGADMKVSLINDGPFTILLDDAAFA